MITLITGTPGSGKTLFSVSEILQKYLSESITLEDGTTYPRRLCVDGIRDLIIDHVMMSPTKVTDKAEPEMEGDGVGNWWKWCKPGDVIVIDECQRIWRPRGMGVKPPQMIAELETHRHRGVDFVIITQHPMLIDQNVRRLVGRHVHIRRVWGMARTVHYEWDHCSSPDRVADAGKTYKPYPKDGYKLYKSAEAHTKQGGKIPFAFYVLGAALVALPVVIYNAVGGVGGILNPVSNAASKAQTKPATHANTTLSATPPALVASAPAPAASSPVVTVAQVDKPAEDEVTGCAAMRHVCRCYVVDGSKVSLVVKPQDWCEQETRATLLPAKPQEKLPTSYGVAGYSNPADAAALERFVLEREGHDFKTLIH